MSLLRNTLVQASLTLVSRVLGFARDIFIAARLGQGAYADAWSTALVLPNFFRRLFAEGAFAQAFVPTYARTVEAEGQAEAQRIASEAMSFLLAVVAGLCIAMQLAMPFLMPYLSSAYRGDPDILQLMTLVAQITMPYLAAMTLASLLSGVLNTAGRFALTAFAPTLLNVCTLVPLILFTDPDRALTYACVAVAVAGVLQVVLLWIGVRRTGARLRFGWPRLTKDVRQVLVIAIPGAIAGGATQLNTLVSQVLVGSDQGARAALYNADRLYQLPLGLIGVAIGLSLVPRLSKMFVADDTAGAKQAMDEGLVLSMAFTLPAAAAFLTIPFFILDATLTRGLYTSEDARRVADALLHFAWGVPAFVLAKVFTPPFFARHDTKRPMRFALITVGLNIVLGFSLFVGLQRAGIDGIIGLAIATSATAWLNVLLLAGTLAREGTYRPSPETLGRLARLLLASAVMAAVLAVASWQRPAIEALVFGSKELAITAVVLAGGVVYAAMCLAVRAIRLSEVRRALRREPGAPGLPSAGEG
jgi:putative peptidoglycan lipid II flippase